MNDKLARQEFCKDSFDAFLIQNTQTPHYRWEPVKEGQDPPDYYLTVSDQKFAVEVTSTKTITGNSRIGLETYESTHTSLVDEIRKEAQQKGILVGYYAIAIFNPLTDADPKYSRIKKAFISKALNVLDVLRYQPLWSRQGIAYNGQELAEIIKVSEDENEIEIMFDGDAEWIESLDFLDKITSLLQCSISEKKEKLERKDEQNPAILLILNTYPLASIESYQSIIQKISGILYFHTVFLVMCDRRGSILFSKEPSWT